MTIAKYENGVFRPLEIVQMKEGTVVEVLVPADREAAGKRRSIKDLPFYLNYAHKERPERWFRSADDDGV
jgi:predicted DNA-binding antitoxin AbrB/MazE fold protein